ncbi:YafY family protein [Allokutzneria multivorans]
MLETSARLLRLLSLLQTPREWTGTELADRLEVSTRTVRNDVERLRALGYPVNANRGSAGGYRLGAGAELPPLLLDDEEAVAVTIGLHTAAGGTIAGIEETALRALAKVERVLPSRLRRRVSALQDYTVAVPRDEPGPRVDSEVLVTLTAACRDRERLRFRYRSHGGEPSARLVEPYQLVNWGRRWYLVAWDAEREDWRTFRVDRLTEPFATGARFTPRELPEDVVDRVRRGVSSAAWRYTAKVIVHASAEVVAARIHSAVGTVRALDADTCELHTGSETLNGLAVHLGLLDLGFTVTEPPELVDLVRRLSDRYGRAVGP